MVESEEVERGVRIQFKISLKLVFADFRVRFLLLQPLSPDAAVAAEWCTKKSSGFFGTCIDNNYKEDSTDNSCQMRVCSL